MSSNGAVFVSRKALGETGQNDGGFVGREGHSKFLQKQRLEWAQRGKIIAARGSGRFAG
ncbi:hypothetical protein [Mucilaginibacter sp.]|uniref:hypothetical protein n=1 Tax=Mucilaginibacter sp. TaxID=1882438 RepID=UPI002ED492E1